MRNRSNITITLENDLAQQARIEAARRNISVSALCAESLKRSLSRTRDRQRALAELSPYLGKGFDEDEGPLSREEIYNDRIR